MSVIKTLKKIKQKIEKGISYEILFEILEDARNDFLSRFNQIRADFEHQNLQIENFDVSMEGARILIKEPSIGEEPIIQAVTTFYEKLLDFIELLMAFYFGLKTYEKSNGFMTLFKRKEFDFSNLRYKYVIFPAMGDSSVIQLIR